MVRALKNPLKSAICLHAFIERVKYPGMSYIMPGLGCMPSYLQLTFIESSRHKLEGVVTTRSSREESSTFCTSTSISFTSGKHYTPHPLPLTTRLPLSRVVSALRPGSDAVLHMSRIEFNELRSCEVRRLNQFDTADIIRIGLAVLHAWLSRE